MKRLITTIFFLAFASIASAQGVPNIQNWTAQPGYATSIQNQINALKANLGPAPSAANAGEFLISNGTIANYYALSGGITCSTTTPGLCTVTANGFNLTNDTGTGTIQNKLVKFTGAPSTGIRTATTDVAGAIGICTTGCGASGTATIQYDGGGSCVFDGATTAGDYVTISSSVAGDCHDTGSTTAPTASQPIGIVLSTNVSGGTYSLYFNTINTAVASGTPFSNPMTTLGDIMYENATPAAARLAGNTTSSLKILTQTGTGSVSAAPTWSTPTSAIAGTSTGMVFVFGAVTASQVVYFPSPISVTFPATFGSGNIFGSCSTNPSESDAYTLKSGGTTLGTITLDTSCAATYSTTTASHVAAAGEKVEVDAPATVSGNVSISVQVTR